MGSAKGSGERAIGGFTTIHDTERAAPIETELSNNIDRFANLVQRYNFAEHVSEVVDIDALVEQAIEDRGALDRLSKCQDSDLVGLSSESIRHLLELLYRQLDSQAERLERRHNDKEG